MKWMQGNYSPTKPTPIFSHIPAGENSMATEYKERVKKAKMPSTIKRPNMPIWKWDGLDLDLQPMRKMKPDGFSICKSIF